jgi:hypothetical protein
LDSTGNAAFGDYIYVSEVIPELPILLDRTLDSEVYPHESALSAL